MKKVKYLFLLAFVFLLVGCTTKTPFFVQNNGETKDAKETFHNPVYYFAEDYEGTVNGVEGVEFVNNPSRITFSNFKMSDPDKDGNVIVSYDTEIAIDIEFFAKPQENRWYYNYVFNNPMLVDYYTGEIYKRNSVTSGGAKSFQNGALLESKEEFKDTEIKFGNKKTTIGLYSVQYDREYADLQLIDQKDDEYHYQTEGKTKITTYVKMPKNYTGVMIVVNKKGADKEFAEELFEDSKTINDILSIEDEKERNAKLKELEKDSNIVHKLVDPKDKEREGFYFEDYEFISLAEALNIKKAKTINWIPIMIVIGVLGLIGILVVILVVVAIVIASKKSNKEEKKVEAKPVKEEPKKEVKEEVKKEPKKEEKKEAPKKPKNTIKKKPKQNTKKQEK